MNILRQVLEFAIDYIGDQVDNARVTEGLKLVLPQVIELTEIDRFDAQARAHLQAKIDDTLRAAHLI
jgi:hypothetical protein